MLVIITFGEHFPWKARIDAVIGALLARVLRIGNLGIYHAAERISIKCTRNNTHTHTAAHFMGVYNAMVLICVGCRLETIRLGKRSAVAADVVDDDGDGDDGSDGAAMAM